MVTVVQLPLGAQSLLQRERASQNLGKVFFLVSSERGAPQVRPLRGETEVVRQRLSPMDNTTFDAIIVGGGINGTGIAARLAAVGYRVLLLEKQDYGAGASSRSTRLIHSGPAYLAEGASSFWSLVSRPSLLVHNLLAARRSLANQREVWRSQSRWVHHLAFLVPDGRGNPFKSWQTELGLRALNVAALTRGRVDFWRVKNPEDYLLLRYHRPEGSGGALAFGEVVADAPERICVNLALEAEANGAITANYARVSRLSPAGSGWCAGIEDLLYGQTLEVRTPLVVNAAGPWSGELDRMGSGGKFKRMEPVKGAHLLVKTSQYQSDVALLTFNSEGNDPTVDRFFAIPFRGLYMVGNTHTSYEDDLDHVYVTDAEIEFLLGMAQAALPGAHLTEDSVVYTYAGVRPMSVINGQRKLEPVIHDLEEEEGIKGMITVTGAPVTDYPWTGRKVLRLARAKIAAAGYRVKSDKPPPSALAETDLSTLHRVPIEAICKHGPATLRDAAFGLLREQAVSLSDVLCRRTVHVWNECLGLHCARRVADFLAPIAGWDSARVKNEVNDYKHEVMSSFRPQGAASYVDDN